MDPIVIQFFSVQYDDLSCMSSVVMRDEHDQCTYRTCTYYITVQKVCTVHEIESVISHKDVVITRRGVVAPRGAPRASTSRN
mmetsp:Transcript_1152/g.4249  ORF Transcript_1152/g.4249 Transcript_1152/m.4249 type:complete len:82 (+) Transcript_1152:1970-2215(+)